MGAPGSVRDRIAEPYVSTGTLPPPDRLQIWITEAYEQFRTNTDGETSDVYPELAKVSKELFGICVAGTSGSVYGVGYVEHEFIIMSVS